MDIPTTQQVRVNIDGEWIVEHWNETGVRLDGGNSSHVADGDLYGTFLMRSQILYVEPLFAGTITHPIVC